MGRFDVAVVGGGPAGAWTAYRMASSGVRVALIDGSHPREKPCGGGLTGRALDLVRSSGALEQLAGVVVGDAAFEFAGQRVHVDLRLPGGTPLLVASRTELDGRLLVAAIDRGATHVAHRAVDVTKLTRGWHIATRRDALECDWIIGADGANSLVRRRAFRPFARADLSIATGCFVDGATDTTIDLIFETDPPGYLWSFPRPDHLAVGICAQADESTVAALMPAARRWIDDRLGPGRQLRRYTWPIPSLRASTLDRDRNAGDGWMLVGDAAGLVDPITREGIYFALAAANIAATAMDGRDPSMTYKQRIADEIHPELRRAARLKAQFYRPPFLSTMLEGLASSASIRGVMADLVAGRRSTAVSVGGFSVRARRG